MYPWLPPSLTLGQRGWQRGYGFQVSVLHVGVLVAQRGTVAIGGREL